MYNVYSKFKFHCLHPYTFQIHLMVTDQYELFETDFNGVMVVQNYLKRTGREEWAGQVDTLL